ncbi:Protein kinase superfamily protein [Rhynchospora pubera]|uniref:Protein kinase superfamily protein n=1 Tax=Rhynchospora pubera TaxID=906938 RepID=A0AAV8GK00_9POAL|nr:Protein kinase superfamily protein [Rhynchospora pubera]
MKKHCMAIERSKFNQRMEGNCILLGLQMDEIGKKLLDWTLNKLSREGDRIVVVHVCKKSALTKMNTLALIKVLDDYLAEYEALCSMKQIILVGRVTPGKSIQKVLVDEAKLCAAMTVVVGVNKNFSFGGSASLAKYCAKHLPPTTSVFAVQNGKTVFQREATKPPEGGEPKPVLRTVLHPSVGMDPKVIIPNPDRSLSCINKSRTELNSSKDLYEVNSSNSIKNLEEQQRLGWPLLRRTASNLNSNRDAMDVRKQSVVHWVMNLPKRLPELDSPDCELSRELMAVLNASNSTSSCKMFSYKELCDATNQFSSENLIGKGGSSKVFKGCLQNDDKVAIKLSKINKNSSRDFLREVEIMTKLNHNRIVPLIGVCVEANSLISIYSYISKGSLEENLNCKKADKSLPWEKRVSIAREIASTINYLHIGCDRPVIHRDIKSSNILLTDEHESQLSDFGLAVWAPPPSSSVTHGDVVGTFGYLAPEYFMYGKVSRKIDVYAFGVVLLELLTGRKCISGENPEGQQSLVMWATPILKKGDINELLDPALDGEYDEAEARRMALAASLCLIRSARLRPQISQILSLLEGEESIVDVSPQAEASTSESDCVDDETYPVSNLSSHLGLALLDVDDVESISSTEYSNISSLEEYLRDRWSRTSSFD